MTVADQADVLDTILHRGAGDPETTALAEGTTEITYGELASRVEALADVLAGRGVGPGDLVALVLPRGVRAVVALLAVLECGAAYVPLDTGAPRARLRTVLAEARPALTVVDRTTREHVEEDLDSVDLDRGSDLEGAGPGGAPRRRASPDDPAYVIFTSGSTGRPKGVVVPRRAVSFFCAAARTRYGTAPGDRVLQFASLGFDASVDEILLPLSVGATVVFRDDEMLGRPDLFLARCREWGLTVVGPPTAYWHEILAELERSGTALPPTIRLVIIGGEAVHAQAVGRWRAAVGPGVRLLNCYGPTETTVAALSAELADWTGDGPVPIGTALPGVELRIEPRAEDPEGTGELWIGGPGVATGYLARPDLTADVFRTEPDAEGPPRRWYRTGDVVTRLEDGQLAYLRRLDQQVQVRGVRVELGEVEAALRAVPGVREAAVVAVDSDGTTGLVAHVLRRRDGDPDERAVRAELGARLPAAMVPARIRFHATFPRSANGKVDLAALRSHDEPAPAAGPAVADPVVELWSEVLGRGGIGPDDDLVGVGASSLDAVRILARLRAEFGLELGLAELHAAGTPARIHALITAGTRPAGTVASAPAVPPRPTVGEFALTGLQRDYWLTELLNRDLPLYMLGVRYRLERPVDHATLVRALAALVRRHPALGARFPEHDDGPAMVVDGTGGIPVGAEPVSAPVDLARGPLVRATLGPEGDVLTILAHHLVFDGWSAGVLARDLGRLLETPGAIEVEPAGAVPRYVEPVDDASREADLAYWRARLAEPGPPAELPTDRPRPTEPTFAAFRRERALTTADVERWTRLGRRCGASLFTVVLTAVSSLLTRHTGRTDVAVLAPVANRSTPESEDEIGALLNTLPLRTDTSGDPAFATLLEQVRDRTLADLDHQRLPLPEILAAAGHRADPDRHPVSGLLLTVHNTPYGDDGPVRYAGEIAPPGQPVDLSIALDLPSTGPRLSITARGELFDAERVDGVLDQLVVLMDAAAAAPGTALSRLPLRAPQDPPSPAAAGPECPPRFPLVRDHLADVARRAPRSPALTVDGSTLDYGELDARANRLANHLVHRHHGGPIALALPRDVDLFVAIWAVLTTGHPYLALDVEHPPERLDGMLADSGARTVVTRREWADVAARAGSTAVLLDDDAPAIAAASAQPPAARPQPHDPAYLVYTSGSTGAPKAVVVTHDNLAHAVEMWCHHYDLQPGWTHQQVAGVAFDVFVGETMRALCSGGRLVVVPRETALDPPALLALMRRERVAVTELVPSVLRRLLALGEPLDDLALLAAGGETWPAEEYRLARRLVPHGRVVNSYGVTEATVDSTCFEGPLPDGATTVPIGRPYPNQRAYVLDEHGALLPPGPIGELHLGGPGVAAGYHGRPELTRERFRDDPFRPGGRMYRTGDAARLRPDGSIEFLGRHDDQVKVRGQRLELGEIEAALRAAPGVTAAAAALHGDDLVGYVVADDEDPATEARTRAALATRLPGGAIPATIVFLAALPLTANGKLDRAALPAPPARVAERVATGPTTTTEQRVADVWAEHLGIGVDTISVDATYAELGGDSFAAVRMARALSEQLRLVDVYRHPTLRDLAAHLDRLDRLAASGTSDADADRLLQRLTDHPADPALDGVTVVGLPYAAGSAASFLPLADALPPGWSLLAVELPGHDPGRDEPLAPIREVAARVVDELADVGGPILIYGHCVGTAPALEVARLAVARGLPVIGLGLGAQFPVAHLPGRFFGRLRRWVPSDGLVGNRRYLDFLRSRGGFADVDPDDARAVLATVRHDTREAEDYFTDTGGSARLPIPILTVVGERDRNTELHEERHHEWETYGPHVELAVIPRGGHFFVRHQAGELADLLVDAVRRWRATDPGGTDAGPVDPRAPGRPQDVGEPPATGVEPSLGRFSLVAAGQIIAMIGSGISTLVMAIWALGNTGDLSLFGLLSAIGVLPGILALPWAGAAADRFDRRRVMIVANGVSTLSMATLAVLVTTGGMHIWHVAVALSLTSLAGAFQRPAYLAAVAQLVPKRYLGNAAGISQLGVNVGQVAGPLLGAALLVAVDIGGVLLIEAAGFALGLLTLLPVRFPDRAFKRREETLATEIRRGWSYITRRPELRAGLWFFVVDHAIYTVGFTLVTPLILARSSPIVLGTVLAAGGVGGLLGALTMSLWGGTRRRTDGMIVAMGLGGIALLVVGLAGNPVLAGAGMFVLMFTEAIIDGSWIAVLGSKVDPQLLGRTMAIFTTLPLVTVPVGFLVVVPLADVAVVPLLADPATTSWLPSGWFGTGGDRGLALLVVVSGALLALWAVRGWFHRRLRHAETTLPDAVPAAEILDRDAEQRRADALVPDDVTESPGRDAAALR